MMLDLVGLLGMLSQSFIKTSLNGQEFNNFYRNHIHIFCSAILVWRFFGISSGCVAFIMAVDRYFALTKPFYYCQHFTNGLIKRLISIMWLSCALLTFAPILGFGKFCDDRERKCERYRDAHETLDVIYAWLFFIVGMLHTFTCEKYI
jgi:prostaglandin E receptor 4